MLDHLLLQCVYSREVWFKVLHCMGWQQLSLLPTDVAVNWWLGMKQ
jgi:hypothetical protein